MEHAGQKNNGLIKRLDSLADPTRLRLLRLLERQELGVMELCEVLILPQSTISRHLKVLVESGWLSCRQQGATNLYGFSETAKSDEFHRLWLPVREQSESWLSCRQDKDRLGRLLVKRRREAQRFFHKAAKGWDSLREEMYGKDLNQAALLSLLPADWIVADLGCGTGRLALELSRVVRKVIGVDQSADMLRTAMRRSEGHSRVDFRKGSLEAIPIKDEECHAAMMLLVLTYVEQPARVIRESARILRPGGKLIVVDLGDHDREDFQKRMGQLWPGFKEEEMKRFFREAGLGRFSLAPLPPNHTAKGPPLFLGWAEKMCSAECNGSGC